MNQKQKRPKFLNLFAIRLPVTGVTSFAHRVSGALMVLAIPLVIYVFGLSLRGQEQYTLAVAILATWPMKLVLSVLGWTLAHHLFAGVRFLLMDINIGGELGIAKVSAWLVNLAGLLSFLAIIYKIWL